MTSEAYSQPCFLDSDSTSSHSPPGVRPSTLKGVSWLTRITTSNKKPGFVRKLTFSDAVNTVKGLNGVGLSVAVGTGLGVRVGVGAVGKFGSGGMVSVGCGISEGINSGGTVGSISRVIGKSQPAANPTQTTRQMSRIHFIKA